MSQDGVSGPDLVFKLRVVKRGQLALEAVAADPDSSRELAERALARFPKLAMGLASASSSRGGLRPDAGFRAPRPRTPSR
jgi:hypothetical protein